MMDIYFKSFWQQVIIHLRFELPHYYYYYLLFMLGPRGFGYSLKLLLNRNLINNHKILCSLLKKRQKEFLAELELLQAEI